MMLLHTDEEFTCPIMNAPDDFHFEMRCEDCDVKRLSHMPLGDVMDRFGEGRVTCDEYDAYRWVWALLSPLGPASTYAHWASQPYTTDPDVRRIARKLCRIRDFEIPEQLIEKGSAGGDQAE